jgi:hypothetical protein
MDDCMITSDTPNASLQQAIYGFKQAMSLNTTPVLRTNHHPNSSSEQMPLSREEREMGTQIIQNPLLARTTDTSLSLKDTSDIQSESPSRYTNERIQPCRRKTLNGQKSVPGLDTEGVHSKDTLKMDEPIALRTRRKLKLQYPYEPRKDTILLDKTDTEMRELLIHLIAHNKEQQDQIKARNLMLNEVLAQQTSIVSKLHDTETELLWQRKSKGKYSTHEEVRKVVKQFGPRAELNKKANVCTMLPTTSLDDSNVNSHESHNSSILFYEDGRFDSLQNGKTRAQTNVKDVQKASNRAILFKYLELSFYFFYFTIDIFKYPFFRFFIFPSLIIIFFFLFPFYQYILYLF